MQDNAFARLVDIDVCHEVGQWMAFALRHVGLDLTESAEKRPVDDELRVIGEHVRQPGPVACVNEVAVPSWQFVQLEPIMVVHRPLPVVSWCYADVDARCVAFAYSPRTIAPSPGFQISSS